MPHKHRRPGSPPLSSTSRRDLLKKTAALGAAAAAGPLGFPAIVRAQAGHHQARPPDAAHRLPRPARRVRLSRRRRSRWTRVNAAGGVLGRKVELIAEDSVNPATAVTKAQKLIERDKVVVPARRDQLGLGARHRASRRCATRSRSSTPAPTPTRCAAQNCNRYMFHVEGCNTMYTKTIGTWQKENNLIKGAQVVLPHRRLRLRPRPLPRVVALPAGERRRCVLANDMVPTNTADYSAYILKIRYAKPDFVYINLAGVDQTTFLKQYREYNLPFPLTGGVMDTVPFWAAGIDSLSGHWQSLWYHGLDDRRPSQAFTKRFTRQVRLPAGQPGVGRLRRRRRSCCQAIAETKSTDSAKLVEYFEKGASVRHPEGAQGQLPQAGTTSCCRRCTWSRSRTRRRSKDKWDIFEIVQRGARADGDRSS